MTARRSPARIAPGERLRRAFARRDHLRTGRQTGGLERAGHDVPLRRGVSRRHQETSTTVTCDEVRNIHGAPSVKEDGLERLAGADSHPGVAAIDHFFAGATRRADAERGAGELGDFADGRYEFELVREENSVGVEMKRTGVVKGARGECSVTVRKRVRLMRSGTVRVEYELVPDGDLDVLFAPEWNLSFLTPDEEWVTFHVGGGEGSGLRKKANVDGVDSMTVDDRLRGQRVSVSCAPPAGVWTWPLDTASHSEGGLERVFQGLTLLTRWPVRARRGERVCFEVEFEFSRLSGGQPT